MNQRGNQDNGMSLAVLRVLEKLSQIQAEGHRKKILIGKERIKDYLEISDFIFDKFIKMGMPALYLDGRWYAHTENLEKYFKGITWVKMKEVPEETDQES